MSPTAGGATWSFCPYPRDGSAVSERETARHAETWAEFPEFAVQVRLPPPLGPQAPGRRAAPGESERWTPRGGVSSKLSAWTSCHLCGLRTQGGVCRQVYFENVPPPHLRTPLLTPQPLQTPQAQNLEQMEKIKTPLWKSRGTQQGGGTWACASGPGIWPSFAQDCASPSGSDAALGVFSSARAQLDAGRDLSLKLGGEGTQRLHRLSHRLCSYLSSASDQALSPRPITLITSSMYLALFFQGAPSSSPSPAALQAGPGASDGPLFGEE